MSHIDSFIWTNVSIILVFLALLILLILNWREEKRKRSMDNHPAGKGRNHASHYYDGE